MGEGAVTGANGNGAERASESTTATGHGRWRAPVWLVIRLAVGVGALWWTLSRVSLDEMASAVGRVTVTAALLAVLLTFGNLGIGATRWRVLLTAYGAEMRPPVLLLARIYLVSIFYNTFLPGNVGGDVLRGHVTRRAFQGAAGAYLIVAVERVFGLAGLLLLAAGVATLHPLPGVANLPALAGLGVVAALLAAASPLLAHRLAPLLPGRLGVLAAGLPAVRRPALLPVVLLLSLGTQAVVALTGHVLIDATSGTVRLADSLALVPIAMAAMYFPATVAGLGVREAAFVFLFTQVGVARADATAASLAFLGVQLVVALIGGVTHWLRPLELGEVDTRMPPREARETSREEM